MTTTSNNSLRWGETVLLAICLQLGCHRGAEPLSFECHGECDERVEQSDEELVAQARAQAQLLCLEMSFLTDQLLTETIDSAVTSSFEHTALLSLGFAAVDAPSAGLQACRQLVLDLRAWEESEPGNLQSTYRSPSAVTALIGQGLADLQSSIDEVADFSEELHAAIDGDGSVTGQISQLATSLETLSELSADIDARELFGALPARQPRDDEESQTLQDEWQTAFLMSVELDSINLGALSVALEHSSSNETASRSLARMGRRAGLAAGVIRVLQGDLLELSRDAEFQPRYRTAGSAARVVANITDGLAEDVAALAAENPDLAEELNGFAASLPELQSRLDELTDGIDARGSY